MHKFWHKEHGLKECTEEDAAVLIGCTASTVHRMIKGRVAQCRGWRYIWPLNPRPASAS